jgi:hypothetical protein
LECFFGWIAPHLSLGKLPQGYAGKPLNEKPPWRREEKERVENRNLQVENHKLNLKPEVQY